VGNAFGELFALSEQAEVYSFFVAIAVVLGVIIIWGPKTLTREKKAPDSIQATAKTTDLRDGLVPTIDPQAILLGDDTDATSQVC